MDVIGDTDGVFVSAHLAGLVTQLDDRAAIQLDEFDDHVEGFTIFKVIRVVRPNAVGITNLSVAVFVNSNSLVHGQTVTEDGSLRQWIDVVAFVVIHGRIGELTRTSTVVPDTVETARQVAIEIRPKRLGSVGVWKSDSQPAFVDLIPCIESESIGMSQATQDTVRLNPFMGHCANGFDPILHRQIHV